MKNDHQANKTIPIGIPMFEDVSFKFVAIDMGYIYIYTCNSKYSLLHVKTITYNNNKVIS